jgi:hypothetical protein
MNTVNKNIGMEAMKARLSTLWIFVMINMLSADIFSFMLPASASDAPVQVTQAIMLAFAVVIEIPIAMIFLSRVLKYRANRLVNIIACVITILFVIAGGSMTLHYLFFATVEVVTMLLMIRYAWKWTNPETGADQK